jgi:hypothetical protein
MRIQIVADDKDARLSSFLACPLLQMSGESIVQPVHGKNPICPSFWLGININSLMKSIT